MGLIESLRKCKRDLGGRLAEWQARPQSPETVRIAFYRCIGFGGDPCIEPDEHMLLVNVDQVQPGGIPASMRCQTHDIEASLEKVI